MMQNRSEYAIHLHHDGLLYTFRPGDTIPEWAHDRVNNPYVRGETPDPRAGMQATVPRAPQAAPAPAPATEDPADDPDADTARADGDSSRPAESGVGSSRTAWEEYARSKGIEVAADWKREDIIAACVQAGH